jgi:hypothetical protein
LLKRILVNGARTGAALSLTSAAALLVLSANENDGQWGAINSISHIVDGDSRVYTDSYDGRSSAIGLTINTVAMMTWGSVYEAAFGKVELPTSLCAAAALTGAAYLLDYHIVPPRYTPGIERKISKKAVFTAYGIMALTLALSPLFRHRKT